MNENATTPGGRSADLYPGLRLVALVAVITGVVLLAAAAFVLSYAGIHAIALAAGVSPTLAKLYPLIFDAMLVVASAAALALRGGGWWTKLYAWLSLLVLLAAASAADAIHAMGVTLPRRPTAAVVAVTPWVLLLIGFGLWLALLRHLRASRAGGRRRGNGRDLPAAGAPHGTSAAPQPAVARQPATAPQLTVARQPAVAPPQRPAATQPTAAPPTATAPQPTAVPRPATDPPTPPRPDAANPPRRATEAVLAPETTGAAAPVVPVAAGGAASPAAETAVPTGGSGIIADAGQATTARHAKESAHAGPKATVSGLATFTARVTEDTDAAGSVDADRTSDPITSETGAAHPAGADGSVSAGQAGESKGTAAADDPAHTGQAGESKGTAAAGTADDSAHTGQSKGTAAAGLADDSARTGEAGGPGDAEDAELALDAEPGMDDPTSDEAHPAGGAEPGDGGEPGDGAAGSPAAEPGSDRAESIGGQAGQHGPAPVPQQPLPAPVPAPSPHFDRMRSTPTPPGEEPEQEA